MELKKVYQATQKEHTTQEVHEGWYGRRLRFTVHVYNDGTLHIGVWDHKTDKLVVDVNLD